MAALIPLKLNDLMFDVRSPDMVDQKHKELHRHSDWVGRSISPVHTILSLATLTEEAVVGGAKIGYMLIIDI